MASTMTEYKRKIKQMQKLLGGVCCKCGTKKNLQFDHVDHTKKSFNIAQNWGLSWKRLSPELKKCQLLCKKHHLSKSKIEGSLAKGWTNQPRPRHGTVWMYAKYGCRCVSCKTAKSIASKREYQKKVFGV